MDHEMIQQMRERLLLCSVCMNEYKDPRILPCHHSLCLECIASMTRNADYNGRFSCPQCREDVLIPHGGIKKLPVNFYLVSLQDELGTNANDGMCHICAKENVRPQFHCMDCDKDICRFCISSHRLEEHLERSNIVRIGSSVPSSPLTVSYFCENHSSETLQLFCYTCYQAICITCSCDGHKHHNLVPLSKQLQESKMFMQKELDKMLQELDQANKSKMLIETEKKDVENTSNKSFSQLDDTALKVCESIMTQMSMIKKEIESSVKIQNENIDSVERKLHAYMDMLYKGQDFLCDLQESDICMEAIDSYKKYSANLKAVRDQYTSCRVQIQHRKFSPSNYFKAMDLNFGIGRKTIVYSVLGNLQSKQLTMSVDSKTLGINSKHRGVFALLTRKECIKFYLFIISFLLFTFMFNLWDEYDVFLKLNSWFSVFGNIDGKAFSDFFTPE